MIKLFVSYGREIFFSRRLVKPRLVSVIMRLLRGRLVILMSRTCSSFLFFSHFIMRNILMVLVRRGLIILIIIIIFFFVFFMRVLNLRSIFIVMVINIVVNEITSVDLLFIFLIIVFHT